MTVVLLTAALSLGAGDARATDTFQEHYELAVRLYLSERYPESLREFEAAYTERQLPRLLINIGTVHRKLGQARAAIDAYERYLKIEPNPEPEVREKLKQCLEQAQALLQTQTLPSSEAAGGAASAPTTTAGKPAAAKARPAAARRRLSQVKDSPAAKRESALFVAVPTPTNRRIEGVVRSARNALWIVDGSDVWRHDRATWQPAYRAWPHTLTALWGEPSGRMWAVGRGGQVLHFDGMRWFEVPSGTMRNLVGVWGAGATDVWIMDVSGAVLHLQGTDWIEAAAELPEGLMLEASCALGPDAVYAVGRRGAVVYWDGKALVKLVSGTSEDLHGVWASGPKDVWAVGDHGVVIHFDGQRWSTVPSGMPNKVLWHVWGTGPRDIWAVGGDLELVNGGDNLSGSHGVALHFNGTAWDVALGDTPPALVAVWGPSPSDLYVSTTSGALLHYDGTRWSEPPRRTTRPMRQLWGRGADDLWAVGEDGAILHFDGHRWSARFGRVAAALQGLYTAGPRSLWAVGEGGAILHDDGMGWQRQDSPTTENLTAVWAAAKDDVAFAVGERGTVIRYDGARWSSLMSGTMRRLFAVWGSGHNDVWVAGDAVLLHWDGQHFSPVAISDVTNLPEVYTVPLRSIWGAQPDDVWVVGDRGLMLHYDGRTWQHVPLKLGKSEHLGAIFGTGPRDVWAVVSGSNQAPATPRMLHYDGRSWSQLVLPQFVSRLWVDENEVWCAGEGGLLLRLARTVAAQ